MHTREHRYFRLQIETSARQVFLSRSRRGVYEDRGRIELADLSAATGSSRGKTGFRTKYESGARNARVRNRSVFLHRDTRAAAPSVISFSTLDDKFVGKRYPLSMRLSSPLVCVSILRTHGITSYIKYSEKSTISVNKFRTSFS